MNEVISIHAPRTGSDNSPRHAAVKSSNFNPRSPHGERPSPSVSSHLSSAFQSTLPARGATPSSGTPASPWRFQSTLPARGATLTVIVASVSMVFQSTLPARGATQSRQPPPERPAISIHAPRTGSDENLLHTVRDYIISIHAPRTGSDGTAAVRGAAATDFNPRSPHGERRYNNSRKG